MGESMAVCVRSAEAHYLPQVHLCVCFLTWPIDELPGKSEGDQSEERQSESAELTWKDTDEISCSSSLPLWRWGMTMMMMMMKKPLIGDFNLSLRSQPSSSFHCLPSPLVSSHLITYSNWTISSSKADRPARKFHHHLTILTQSKLSFSFTHRWRATI